MDIKFTKGVFVDFMVTQRFTLGAIGESVEEGDILQYDGTTVVLNGSQHVIPSIRGAIRVKWIVPQGEVEYVATRTAPVEDPAPRQEKGGPAPFNRAMGAVATDERQVGFATRAAQDRSMLVSDTGASVTSTRSSESEGVAIGRIKTAAQQKTVLTDSSVANRAVQQLDGSAAPARMQPLSKDTSAPAVARTVDPDAQDRAAAARTSRLASLNEGKAAPTPAKVAAPVAPVAADDVSAVEDTDAADRMRLARLVIPDFDWDLHVQWKARVKLALTRRDDPVYLTAILAVETETVRKHIAAALRG